MSQAITPTTVCQACQARVKNWEGTDPKCGFTEGAFSGDNNYCCATATTLRAIAMRDNECDVAHTQCGDQHYATLPTRKFSVMPDEDGEGFMNAQPVCLWIGWYKSRGRIEGMWLMFENLPPRPPTEAECIEIIKHYIAQQATSN